jgi:hypothetical protein
MLPFPIADPDFFLGKQHAIVEIAIPPITRGRFGADGEAHTARVSARAQRDRDLAPRDKTCVS